MLAVSPAAVPWYQGAETLGFLLSDHPAIRTDQNNRFETNKQQNQNFILQTTSKPKVYKLYNVNINWLLKGAGQMYNKEIAGMTLPEILKLISCLDDIDWEINRIINTANLSRDKKEQLREEIKKMVKDLS